MDNTEMGGVETPRVTVFTVAGAELRDAPAEMLEKMDAAAQREAKLVTDAGELLALLNPRDQVVTETAEIFVGDEPWRVQIKVLSFEEAARVDAKKYRRDQGGQIVRDLAFEETNGTAWLIFSCVVRDARAGSPDGFGDGAGRPPEWVPLFSLEQIRGELMANGDPRALSLVHQLTLAIWNANPSLSPIAGLEPADQPGMTSNPL